MYLNRRKGTIHFRKGIELTPPLACMLQAAVELQLDPDYIQCLNVNLVPLETRFFPKSIHRHPAFR
jgi:hypothetical protein